MNLFLFSPTLMTLVLGFAAYVYLSHPQKRLKRKIFGGKMDYTQLLLSFILPLFWNSLIFFNLLFVLKRPRINTIHLPDWLIIYSAFTCAFFSAIGIGIHLTAKVNSWALKDKEGSEIYKVNHFFHGRFSHDLIYISFFSLLFLSAIATINHPLGQPIANPITLLIIISGLLTGIVAAIFLIWINNSGAASLRLFSYFLVVALSSTIFFIFHYSLNLSRFPWLLFFMDSLIGLILTVSCLSSNKLRRKLVNKINSRLAGY